ncbi:MAG: hypothetical protein COX29_04120 [Candidatus Moranbacteria bacterium CG23_combo_of_CG06-09_8_20_14_all_35_22]|nr:MAG: hypothetical protein COX29_04120 [Candidatus Moranbacteria bacterium CG23_combo_of_CG06-09_8_20_14_all_35_22]
MKTALQIIFALSSIIFVIFIMRISLKWLDSPNEGEQMIILNNSCNKIPRGDLEIEIVRKELCLFKCLDTIIYFIVRHKNNFIFLDRNEINLMISAKKKKNKKITEENFRKETERKFLKKYGK